MRSIPLFLVPLVFAACTDANPAAPGADVSPQFAAADVGWIEGVGFEEYTIPVPCLDEDLHFTGTVWWRSHWVVNATRWVWTVQFAPLPDYQAVGDKTGLWLLKPSMLHGRVQSLTQSGPLDQPDPQINRITDARYDFVNQTTGQTLSWPWKMLVVRNASGEVKAEFEVEPARFDNEPLKGPVSHKETGPSEFILDARVLSKGGCPAI